MVDAGFEVIASSKNEGAGAWCTSTPTRSAAFRLNWSSYHPTVMKIGTGALHHGRTPS